MGPERISLRPTDRKTRLLGELEWPAHVEKEDGDDFALDEGDISLIRSMLMRTPLERLMTLQGFINLAAMARNGRPNSD